MANARKIAVQALFEVETSGAYSNLALNDILKKSNLQKQDIALATALFYGVLDYKITLDYVLNSLTKTPFNKVNKYTACVLRTGLYQIMFMDKIPPSAAVCEAVNLIKASKQRHSAGFVNAVLRNALRTKITLPVGNSAEDISIRYSCPVWIVNEFIADYGTDTTEKILAAYLKPYDTVIRVNTTLLTTAELVQKFSESGVEAVGTNTENALVLPNGIAIDKDSLYLNGFYHAQDISSQLCAKLLNPTENERVLDMCAAPGGKTFTMAELMNNKGCIVSCDIYEKRVELIKKGANRLKLSIVNPTVADATVFNKNLGDFNAVLCDVPCSGLGVLGRKPDIKYKPYTDFSELEEIQLSILNNAARYLKKGGRIVYSTCTVRNNENSAIVNKFLITHSNFKLEYSHTFLPHIDNTDGFFAALLVNTD